MNLQNQIEWLKLNASNVDMFDGLRLPAGLDSERAKSAIMLRCGLLTPVYSQPFVMREAIANWNESMQWNFEHLVKLIQTEYKPLENYNRTDKGSNSGTSQVNYGGSELMEYGGTETGTDTETHSGSDIRTIDRDSTETHSGSDQRITSETTGTDVTGTDTKSITERTTGSDQVESTDVISAENSSAWSNDKRNTTVNTYGKILNTEETATISRDENTTKSGTDNLSHGEQISTTEQSSDRLQHGEVIDGVRNVQHGGFDRKQRGGSDKTTTTGSNDFHAYGNIGVTTSQTMAWEEIRLITNFNPYKWIAERFEDEFCLMVY